MLEIVIYRWQIALVVYIVVMTAIVATKPALMFAADGSPKKWGSTIDEVTSPFAPAIVFPILGLLSYFFAVFIEMTLT
jgi:hypothetical protein